ncbi:MAG: phenylalanine--tRNA ligase subunit alpha [Acholeplasmataceae bacterium]|jgi:phenylalanyl-tRNA synthetase alpha chain
MEKIKINALKQIETANDLVTLENIRIAFLSKKGAVSELMKQLKDMDPQERKTFGENVNQLKLEIEQALSDKKSLLENAALEEKLKQEKVDIHLDEVALPKGYLHPLIQVIRDVEDFFIGKGFTVAEGPELETDHFNFEMMNLAKGHPARAMQDSFYVDPERLLRTHTSPVQARSMLDANGQDLAIICPGKVYRRDDDDPTHSHQFMQIEGLYVSNDVNFSHLKGILLEMAKHIFGPERQIRLRPSYFPFTEPSVEVDVSFVKSDGTPIWIEVLGAGMVHPNVLSMANFDPNQKRGFAFGIGVERIAILKYFIDDIRHFYINDKRFLDQFKGVL